MMKFKPIEALSDILCIIRLRIKLISKDFVTLLVLCMSVVLFAILIRSLTVSAEKLSSLPIGMIDLDNSESSKSLISALQKSETLRIVSGSEKELHKLLQDEMITSIFVINKGYEDDLKSGKLKELLTMYYKKDNKSASILADIVAGEIIYPAGFYKSFRYYGKLPAAPKRLTLEQYGSYMEKLVGSSSDFDFAFHIDLKNPVSSKTPEQHISNSLIYNQFIFGILGILIAFVSMFILSQTVNEKENKVEVRLRISRFHILKRDFGNLSALLLWEGLLSLIFTGLVIRQLKSQDIKLWLSIYLLLLLNAAVLGGVMLLTAKLIKRILPYQLFGSALILFTGGLGFYNLLSGFYRGYIDNVVKFIPNSWFIRGFTDIIVYGSRGGYLKEGHRVLIIMALVIIILVTAIDLIQGVNVRRIINEKN